MIRVNIAADDDTSNKLDGLYIEDDWIFLPIRVIKLNTPCEPINSNQALSDSFNILLPASIGLPRTGWEDKGTKNHIKHEA